VKAGRTLISEGEASTNAYIVREGLLQVMLFSIGGHEIILRNVAKGEIFGELAAIDGQVRSATIVALSDCALASIPADVFCATIDAIPGGWLWLARRLSGQVRDLTSRLLERNALRVKSRLHCELLRRCRGVSAGEDIVYLPQLARPAGFEPATPSLEGSCSVQLSYGRVGASSALW
jgi:CRP/FNR family cyclic AMP-dependent transcriptional regulator